MVYELWWKFRFSVNFFGFSLFISCKGLLSCDKEFVKLRFLSSTFTPSTDSIYLFCGHLVYLKLCKCKSQKTVCHIFLYHYFRVDFILILVSSFCFRLLWLWERNCFFCNLNCNWQRKTLYWFVSLTFEWSQIILLKKTNNLFRRLKILFLVYIQLLFICFSMQCPPTRSHKTQPSVFFCSWMWNSFMLSVLECSPINLLLCKW